MKIMKINIDSFAPAQLIRRISRPAAPPSELPCGSLSSTFPKGLDSPFGLPLAVYLDLSQRSRLSKNSACSPFSPVHPANPVRPVKPSLSACLKSTKENKSGLPRMETLPLPWDNALSRGCCSAPPRVDTRYSAALRLPPSLPLMSPFGLPAAGYPASARWHVFAPAQLIRRLSRPGPPSGCLRQSFSAALRLPTLGYTVDSFAPAQLALGPTFGCSISRLPRRSIVFPLFPFRGSQTSEGDRSRLAGIGGQK
jgi:hypothetical protein